MLLILCSSWYFVIFGCFVSSCFISSFHSVFLLRYHISVSRHYCNISCWSQYLLVFHPCLLNTWFWGGLLEIKGFHTHPSWSALDLLIFLPGFTANVLLSWRIKDCSIAHSQGTADSAVRDLLVLTMGFQWVNLEEVVCLKLKTSLLPKSVLGCFLIWLSCFFWGSSQFN